jgi:glycosyltransferase involved in cell wall biosynthesis
MKPQVTVLMPVYNEETNPLLEKCLRQICGQTLKNFELIVLDDASTDGTIQKIKAIVSGIQREDLKIRFITNKNNLDIARTLNIGIKNAEAEYVARIDAGDLMVFERLEKQLKYMNENKETYLLGSLAKWVDINGREIEDIYSASKMPKGSIELKRKCLFSNYMYHPTWFLRKELFYKIGLYDESYRCEDYEFCIRAILNNYGVEVYPEFLTFCFANHLNSKGLSSLNQSKIQNHTVKVKLKALPHLLSAPNIYGTIKSVLFLDVRLLFKGLYKFKHGNFN